MAIGDAVRRIGVSELTFYRWRRQYGGMSRDDVLTEDIVALAREYGRYGYRKIAGLLRGQAGWIVNDKRVERIWRQDGLKVPPRQPKRGRLWFNDGSCIR